MSDDAGRKWEDLFTVMLRCRITRHSRVLQEGASMALDVWVSSSEGGRKISDPSSDKGLKEESYTWSSKADKTVILSKE